MKKQNQTFNIFYESIYQDIYKTSTSYAEIKHDSYPHGGFRFETFMNESNYIFSKEIFLLLFQLIFAKIRYGIWQKLIN